MGKGRRRQREKRAEEKKGEGGERERWEISFMYAHRIDLGRIFSGNRTAGGSGSSSTVEEEGASDGGRRTMPKEVIN